MDPIVSICNFIEDMTGIEYHYRCEHMSSTVSNDSQYLGHYYNFEDGSVISRVGRGFIEFMSKDKSNYFVLDYNVLNMQQFIDLVIDVMKSSNDKNDYAFVIGEEDK